MTVEATVSAEQDGQFVRGSVRDDVGRAVPHARISLSVRDGAGRSVALPPPRPCLIDGFAPRPAGDGYLVEADDQAGFCVRTSQLPHEGTLHILAEGSGGLSGVRMELPFDTSQAPTSLDWDGPIDSVDLDVDRFSVGVLAMTRRAAARLPLVGATVVLSDGDRELTTATTDERGRATLVVATSTLQGPGRGELVARLEGEGGPGLRRPVLRAAHVTLTSVAPTREVVPSSGVTLDIAAQTARGPVTSGVVEARVGADIVGAAEVREGRAGVSVTFDAREAGITPITFSFAPSQPGFAPGAPLTLRVPVRPPSPWRRAPLALLGVGVVAVLVRGWRRAPRTEIERDGQGEARPPALPPWIWERQEGARGLSGRVLDAHDARPIAGACLTVVARDFRGEHTVSSVESDASGAFFLSCDPSSERVLVIEARWHSRLELPLPRPGHATFALTLRRRALVARLLSAAAKAGHPWSQSPEPTPRALATTADRLGEAAIASWATEVEEAAYGDTPVDAAREVAVSALERDLPRPR